MSRPKIALIGGGQVGGNIALLSAQKELGDIVIVDIPEAENFMKGKALDISQLLPHDGYDSKLSGTSNFEDIKDSDVVVITAGFPRQPGMNREDLLQKNLDIMTNVANQVKKYAPNSFVIVVSNPLDAMVYAFHKISGFPKNKVVGMAGALDSARFRAFIAEATNLSSQDVNCMVLGGHGDTMVPVSRLATVGGVPLFSLLSEEKIKSI
jgi:malate dehydrogenase